MEYKKENNQTSRLVWFFAVVALFLVLLLAAGFFFCKKFWHDQVCFRKRCFVVEIAATKEAREAGLMWRDHLDDMAGMLFIFESERRNVFWMKNTRLPLDMIFLDQDVRVVYIASNIQPCEKSPCPTVDPGVDSKYVLEINAGKAAELNIAPGDHLDLRFSPVPPVLKMF